MTPEERIAHAERAWMDAAADPDPNANCVTAAVRYAITVRLTPEIIACVAGDATPARARQRATAMFRAAGFIVEEP